MNTYCCYLRKSTNKQENSFDSQQDVIDTFVASNGGEIVTTFKEEATGSDDSRPVLQQAVEYSVSNGSMLLVSHCDRLSRNLYTVARLNQLKGLTIVVAELGTVHASTLMLNLRTVIACEERTAIRRRIKDTFATLKAQGRTFVRSGCPFSFWPEPTCCVYLFFLRSFFFLVNPSLSQRAKFPSM